MNLLVTRWVDPVCPSPRRRAYGYFTHGTDPPPCFFLIWFAGFVPTVFVGCLPQLIPLPVTGHAVFAALVVLHSRPSTVRASRATSLSLIGLLTPAPTGDSV